MKRTLMTVITVGALALPVGVLAAETDPAQPAEDPVPTTVQPDRSRDRERRHVEDAAVPREQRTGRAADCPVEGTPARVREQIRVAEGTGEGRQAHERDQVRIEEADEDRAVVPTTTEEAAEDPDVTDDGGNLQFRYGAGRGPADR